MTIASNEMLDSLCALAREAGKAILEDKARTSSVELKADESPVTSADLASHNAICAGLAGLYPEVPLLSEESISIPYEERKHWTTYFLIDPLDGTKEFIKGRKEYTVNIALIVDGVPELGVVYVPELQLIFAGAKGLGSFKQVDGEERQVIHVAKSSEPVPRVVGSASHASPQMAGFLEALGAHEMLAFGSSLKICQIADGTAHVYPRLGPTSEWDTAAGHAVVLYAGGGVMQLNGAALDYNQKESILNPFFLVIGPKDKDWASFAKHAMAD